MDKMTAGSSDLEVGAGAAHGVAVVRSPNDRQ